MLSRTRVNIALVSLLLTATFAGCNAQAAGTTSTPTSSSASISAPLPPRTGAAWVYDPRDSSGNVEAGAYVDAIQQYNLIANSGHRVREIYSYGGDMEMYCPGNLPGNCSSSDFYVFYSRDAVVYDGLPAKHRNASAVAYQQGMAAQSNLIGGAPIIAPIIDGAVTGQGALAGFNTLTATQAREFANKVAWRLCGDPTVGGVAFDLEPFNVSTANGQYYFYLQIARDFASTEMSCVDATHPKGRFFAIFASSIAFKPGTASSQRVVKILNGRHNGYWIDPLYDLASEPAGYRTSVSNYASLATAHAYNTANWAKQLGVAYQFGIPSAASYHEFANCTGSACAGAPAPADGQLDYIMAAEAAIDASYARADADFLGTVLWSWSPHIGFGDTSFGPTEPGDIVANYLGGML